MAASAAVAAGPPVAAGAEPGWWALTIRALRCWLVIYRRTWRSSVANSFLGPLFYLFAMGFGLGPLVNAHGSARLGGIGYLQFVAPAILATQAMMTAMSRTARGSTPKSAAVRSSSATALQARP